MNILGETLVIEDNLTIYVCLTDGVNIGEIISSEITNIDKTAPTIGNVEGSTIVGNKGIITVNDIVDGQSGIEAISISKTAEQYEWVKTTDTSYIKEIDGSNANGTWYIYVKDKVGNVSEVKTATISGVIDKVSDINLATTNVSLDIEENKQIELSYNGTPRDIEYISDNQNIAIVTEEGLITAKTPGTTNITVIITDYDGTQTERTIIVKVLDYLVTYDYSTNGGTTTSKTSERVGYRIAVDLTATAIKDGWTFVGWNTSKDSTIALASLTMPNEDITLYAIYKKTVTVTCNYYNGSVATYNTISEDIYNNGVTASIELPNISEVSKNNLTWSGRGWSTSKSSNANIDATSGETINVGDNTIYYASYDTTVTATYYYYNGTAATSESPTATAYMSYDGTLTGGKPTTPTATTLSGYTQRGWSTSNSSTATTSTPGSITANNTYYMSYQYNITITYNLNGGSGTLPSTSTKTGYMDYEGTKTGVNVTISSATLTKTHYDRAGWNTNTSGTGAMYNDGTTYNIKSSTTLYAKWKIKGYYLVNNTTYYNTLYDAIGGASSGNTIEVLATNTDSSAAVSIAKNITINLGNYVVTRSNSITVESGYTLNVTGNGEIKKNSNDLIINNGTINITSGTLSGSRAINCKANSVVKIAGGTVKGSNYAIYNSYAKTTITIDSGTVSGQIYLYGGSEFNPTTGVTTKLISTLTINGGTITGSTPIYLTSNSEAIINAGTITGTSYGIRMSSATAKLTIGNQSNALSTTTPAITGGSYGIYGESKYAFKFYNGIIKGNSSTTYNTEATYRKTGYVPKTTKNGAKYETTLTSIGTTPNYAIGTTGYTTLSSAVAAATAGNTIIALKNYTNSDTVNIDKNIKLNLNDVTTTKSSSTITVLDGKTFTISGEGTLTNSGSIYTITSNGTTNVEVAPEGKITSATSSYAAICNVGTTNIKASGTVSGSTAIYSATPTGIINISSGDIRPTSRGIDLQSGTVNMTGGSITITGSATGIYCTNGNIVVSGGDIQYPVDQYLNSTTGINNVSGTVEIKGGYIWGNYYGIYNNSGKVTINGGNIMANYQGSNFAGIYNVSGTVDITSGYLKGSQYGIYNNSSGTTNITKGTIIGCHSNGIQNYGTLNIGKQTSSYVANAVTIESHAGSALYTSTNVGIYTGVIIQGTYNPSYNTANVTFRSGYTPSTEQITISHGCWSNEAVRDITLYKTTLVAN